MNSLAPKYDRKIYEVHLGLWVLTTAMVTSFGYFDTGVIENGTKMGLVPDMLGTNNADEEERSLEMQLSGE